jgi:hypothetical protein
MAKVDGDKPASTRDGVILLDGLHIPFKLFQIRLIVPLFHIQATFSSLYGPRRLMFIFIFLS